MELTIETYDETRLKRAFWGFIGFLLSVLSCMILFNAVYEVFFNRGNHLARKSLLKYLRETSLPKPELFTLPNRPGSSYFWRLGIYHLYLWDFGGVSLHNENIKGDCTLVPFIGSYWSKRMDVEIKVILNKSISEHYFV